MGDSEYLWGNNYRESIRRLLIEIMYTYVITDGVVKGFEVNGTAAVLMPPSTTGNPTIGINKSHLEILMDIHNENLNQEIKTIEELEELLIFKLLEMGLVLDPDLSQKYSHLLS